MKATVTNTEHYYKGCEVKILESKTMHRVLVIGRTGKGGDLVYINITDSDISNIQYEDGDIHEDEGLH